MPASGEPVGVAIHQRPHAAAESRAEAAGGEGAQVARRAREGDGFGDLVAEQRLRVRLRAVGQRRQPIGVARPDRVDRVGHAAILADEVLEAPLEDLRRPAVHRRGADQRQEAAPRPRMPAPRPATRPAAATRSRSRAAPARRAPGCCTPPGRCRSSPIARRSPRARSASRPASPPARSAASARTRTPRAAPAWRRQSRRGPRCRRACRRRRRPATRRTTGRSRCTRSNRRRPAAPWMWARHSGRASMPADRTSADETATTRALELLMPEARGRSLAKTMSAPRGAPGKLAASRRAATAT